jgi:hypothetical protein
MRCISILAAEQTETPCHRFSGQLPSAAKMASLSSASRWLRFRQNLKVMPTRRPKDAYMLQNHFYRQHLVQKVGKLVDEYHLRNPVLQHRIQVLRIKEQFVCEPPVDHQAIEASALIQLRIACMSINTVHVIAQPAAD